jgi:REP element-mobilizing transposase RayT
VGTLNEWEERGNQKGLPVPGYHRRSLRLKDYDYSKAGYYFITICTQDRLYLFGEVVDGKMILNDAGKMVERLWYSIRDDFQNIYLHEFVVMPNHIHGIIEIIDTVGVPLVGTHNDGSQMEGNHKVLQTKGNHKGLPLHGVRVGDVIGAFKSKQPTNI